MNSLLVAVVFLTTLMEAESTPPEIFAAQRETARIAKGDESKSDESLETNSERPCVAGPFGGYGGRAFNFSSYPYYGKITSIHLDVEPKNQDLSRLTFQFGARKSPSIGGYPKDSVAHHIYLVHDEYITKVEGSIRKYSWSSSGFAYIVGALKSTTSRGIVHGWYGKENRSIAFKAEGGRLKYIAGRSYSRIDQLYFHFDGCKVKFG